MRVAVHHPDGSVSAYLYGRIEDGVHNTHAIFGTVPLDEFVEEVKKRAQDEYPEEEGFKVEVERMVMHPEKDGESLWISAEEFDPEQHTTTPSGNQMSSPDLSTVVRQEAHSVEQRKEAR